MREKTLRRFAAPVLSAALIFLSGCTAAQADTRSAAESANVESFGVSTVLTNEKQGRIQVQTAVPEFSGFSAAVGLNRKIKKLADDGIAQLKTDTADLAPGSSAGADALYYGSYFDYSRNGDVLSVWITSQNYSGGAHGMYWITAFTLNTKTGEYYSSLASLFRSPASGTEKITGAILKKIEAQPDDYMSDAAQTVRNKKGDYKFYLDGGNLTVYFDLYDLMPYAGGIPVFTFPVSSLELKPQLSSLPALGAVRSNGTGIRFQNPVFSDDSGVYLPLEDTAAELGRTVTKKGESYEISGKPVSVKKIQGKVYAPLTFFTETLGDFIVYDGLVLRFFPEPGESESQGAAVELGGY